MKKKIQLLLLLASVALTPVIGWAQQEAQTSEPATVEAAQASAESTGDESLAHRLEGVAERAGITPHALFSQIVVFCIVAWCLKRFAFDPILNVLDERRKRIAESLENAERIKQELMQAETTRKQVLAQANEKAAAMIAEAVQAAAAQGEKRIQEAVAQAEGIIRKAHEAASLERAQLLSEVKREAAKLIVEATAKVTGKVLTEADQRRLREETVQLVS